MFLTIYRFFFISKTPQRKVTPKRYTTSCRVITDDKINEFKTVLNYIDWSELNAANDVNAAYELFINRFLLVYDEKLTIICRQNKSYSKNHKPWVTPAILKSIHHKYSLYKNSLPKNPVSIQKYKKNKNKLTTTIRFAEKKLLC